MKKILNTIVIVAGLLLATLVAVFFMGHHLLPVQVVKIIPITIFILLEVMLFASILMILRQPSIIGKLAALPLLLVVLVLSYLLTQMPIYQLLMNATIQANYKIDADQIFNVMQKGFMVLNIGIWLSLTPIFIVSFALIKQSSWKTPKNIDEYYPAKAKLIHYRKTAIRINNSPLYELELQIQHYEDIYTVKKTIKADINHLITLHTDDYLDVYVHPTKRHKIYLSLNHQLY